MENIYKDLIREIPIYFKDHPYLENIAYSILIIFVFSIFKKISASNISKKDLNSDDKVYFKKKVNQYLNIVLFALLFFLWFGQLQVFFVSIIAFAVAIAVAFKEIIMCVTGGLLLRSSKVFKEGQRIEIDEVRGFVIERSILTTKILEMGPEKNSQQTTGNITTIPNSLILNHCITNESYFRNYSIKAFQFKLSNLNKIYEFEEMLLKKGEAICAPYAEDAYQAIKRFCEKEGIIIPAMSPRTKILIEDGQEVTVLVKIPVKNDQIADVEQMFNRFYLDWKIKEQLDS